MSLKEVDSHLLSKVNFSLAEDASPLAWFGVALLSGVVQRGDAKGCELGVPPSSGLEGWDGKSAGDAQALESCFCKKCFRRVFLGKLRFLMALLSSDSWAMTYTLERPLVTAV